MASVRTQFKARQGGANDARLFCVVTTKVKTQGRFYRLPNEQDLEAIKQASIELEKRVNEHTGELSLIPDEPLPPQGALGFRVQLYGMEQWGNLFTHRQNLALTTLVKLVKDVGEKLANSKDKGLADAVQCCLALSLDKQGNLGNSLVSWKLNAECPAHLFARQAIPMIWDFAEAFILSNSSGSWQSMYERTVYAIEQYYYEQPSAALASSVHIVCRPRTSNEIGDWRDVLQELPQRIHEWMPRLASEGVVGADAIFACLGPALEIFSRYSSVEKASGEIVTLKEYLEYVWAAVSKEALSMIFSNADTTSFEEDARLTAMWLWTLSTGSTDNNSSESETDEDDDEETSSKTSKTGGYTLEYDAARKIAQGLGAHLEQLTRLVEVKGSTAKLLPVSERTHYLFGKEEAQTPSKTNGKKGRKKEPEQLNLFAVLGITETEEDTDWGEKTVPQLGNTTLDRIHQSMILFAAGRSEALKRFLVDEGAGNDQRFWGLAQALSALYPTGTDEKRWVDGVLARKKGLGF